MGARQVMRQDGSASVAALRDLGSFFGRDERRAAAGLILLMAVSGLAEFAILRTFVSFVRGLGGFLSAERAVLLGVPFIVAVVVATILRVAVLWAVQRFVTRTAHHIALRTQAKLLAQPYEFHLRRNSADAIALTEKVHMLVYGVIQPILQTAGGLIVSVALIAAMLLAAPLVALAMLGGLTLTYALLFVVAKRRVAALMLGMDAAINERVKIVQENFGGIRDVILDDSRDRRLARFAKVDEALQSRIVQATFLGHAPRPLLEGLGLVVVSALVIALAQTPGALSSLIPALGLVALAGQRLLPLVQQIYAGATSIVANAPITSDIAAIFALPDPSPKSDAVVVFANDIRLDAVRYRYPGGHEDVLAPVTMRIGRGSRTAFTGPTGGGKSTLVDIISGLLPPSEGLVSVDGVALTPDTRAAWQRHIAHVSQAIFLNDESILANIAPDEPAGTIDRARADHALAVAQLAEFVGALPEGVETRVGERGVRLSGGQRQRLGIARALYKQASLLILDEATSALDEATEAALLKALYRHDPDMTVVLIAHRPSTFSGCDRVFQVVAGRVQELPGSEN